MAGRMRRGLVAVGLAAMLLGGCGAPAQQSGAPAKPAGGAAQATSGGAQATGAGGQEAASQPQAAGGPAAGAPAAGAQAAAGSGAQVAAAPAGQGSASTSAPAAKPQTMTKIEDLKGKNLGTSSRGSTEEVTANVLLRQAGLDPANDVTYVVVPAGSQLATLLAEAIHGMMVNPDLAAVAVNNGLRVLRTVQDVGRAMPAPFSGFVVSQENLQKNPQAIKAWLRANVKAIRYVRENQAESAAIVAKVLGVEPKLAEDTLPKLAQAINPDDLGGFTAEGFQHEVDMNLGALQGQAQVTRIEELADLTLLRQAQRELGVPCRTGYQCQ